MTIEFLESVPPAELRAGQLVDVDFRFAMRRRILHEDQHSKTTTSDPVLQFRKLLRDHIGTKTWTEWADVPVVGVTA